MAVVEAEGKTFRVIKKDIVQNPPPGQEKEVQENTLTVKTLGQILRDVDKGKDVSQIAEKYGITRETAEQICRLYLTHPGVDADGIMRKMGM